MTYLAILLSGFTYSAVVGIFAVLILIVLAIYGVMYFAFQHFETTKSFLEELRRSSLSSYIALHFIMIMASAGIFVMFMWAIQ